MRLLSMLCAAIMVAACGSSGSSQDDIVPDASTYTASDAPTIEIYVPSDGDGQMDIGADLEPEATWPDMDSNTPPKFGPLNPVTLAMGTSTTLDVNPFIEDFHDPDEALVLSWSSLHVAIQDPGDHVLYIVAPIDWHGSETIKMMVTDTDGAQAQSVLQVIVEEVSAPDPDPDPDPEPEDCDTLFSYDAGAGAGLVQLAGTFNNWGQTPDSPDDMDDSDGDGVWELALPLGAGTYKYKYIVDGTTWVHDPDNGDKEEDGYGGFNSIVTVPQCLSNQ